MRPDQDRPPPRRRRIVFVAASALVVVAGIVAMSGGSPFDERAAWTSSDGLVELYAPVWGERAEMRSPQPWLMRRLGLGRLDRRAFTVPEPALLLRLSSREASVRPPVLRGACGCRFEPSTFEISVVEEPLRDAVFAFPTFPRRDAVLACEIAAYGAGGEQGDASLPVVGHVPNPVELPPPAAAADAAAPLPATQDAAGTTWVLLIDDDSRYVVVRAVDSAGQPVRWALSGATLRDASGNESRRAPAEEALQHKLWLPYSGAYVLCIHEPWWELTFLPEGRAPVTFRFRPPPAPDPPR